jgi:flagellar hook assembly protein FlgD
MAFDGKLLTRPSGGREANVSDALVLSYSGVYAPPPSAPVLSPNGDGVGDSETLAYRLPRPSDVVATLAGPGGAKITLASGAEPAGMHTITWDGTSAGKPAAEGTWTFTVSATDKRPVTTSAQRTFSLDDTLSSLAVSIGPRGLPTATFQLTRNADVVVRVERPNGVTVANLRSRASAAGPQSVTWKGRIGRRLAPRGRYMVDVDATSSVGTSSLQKLFSFRPHRRQ